MKRLVRRISSGKSLKPILEQILQIEASIASHWVSSAHKRLMAVQWGLPPQPAHMDHHIDLFYQWLEFRNPLWLERGIFGGLALQGGQVLELACGDGFNARNFYSLRAEHIIACDFDPKAIERAKRENSAPNVEYVLADIRTEMPLGRFDNIVWDAAIEYFTPHEIEQILNDISCRLTSEGVLSGCAIVARADGIKSLSHHQYEFKSKEDLLRFLTPHFKNVTVFETVYPVRHSLYFWASNGPIPFSSGWRHAVGATRG